MAIKTRKLIVEVIDARNLLPKDGCGSSSPYAVLDYHGQRRKTRTVVTDLSPVWNEALEFTVSTKSPELFGDVLELDVLHDKNAGPTTRNNFLGRVRLDSRRFVRRGEEVLIYYPLEKKSLLGWIQGEIGLKIYFVDEEKEDVTVVAAVDAVAASKAPEGGVSGEKTEMPSTGGEAPSERNSDDKPKPEADPEPPSRAEAGGNEEANKDTEDQNQTLRAPPLSPGGARASGNMSASVATASVPQVKLMDRSAGNAVAPMPIGRVSSVGSFLSEKSDASAIERSSFDLVDKMHYLFVRVIKARHLSASGNPVVKIAASGRHVISRPASKTPLSFDWDQTFAFSRNLPDSSPLLEVSVWDPSAGDDVAEDGNFLGGVCFDVGEIPVRDPPDSPLAPQWYHLDGGEGVAGDLQISVWIGTQADDSFPESTGADAPQQAVSYTRPKVYQSPKMWYLRLTVIEAQDLPVSVIPNMPPEIRVKARLGFQSLSTRRGIMSRHLTSFHWNEDLVFVAGEPLEDNLILLLEDRAGKDPLLGHVLIPVGSIEQRIDERHVAAKWHNVDGGPGPGPGPGGRLHLRACLEGGYHVSDEAAHLSSDFRPTAKQLWKPPVGVLELGILGARGLSPVKPKADIGGGGGGGPPSTTDAYCVAKYGKKWVRTRTVADSFDPRWNEQYTWQVYDPCTVLTVGVFDNSRIRVDPSGEDRPDSAIGKVRIRVSTLDSNRVYMSSYPLAVLSRAGLRKTGELELAVRFSCPSLLLPDPCGVYGQPLLPRMHYVRPLGVAQQEALRAAAAKMVAAWLARSEPPLGPEVVHCMLDASSGSWSMRRSRCNWARIVAVLAWAVGLARWLDRVRRWRSPPTTVLVHVLYLVLVWYPDLIVPTGALYVFLVGLWYRRFKPKVPAGMDVRLSLADVADPEDLDEEFDTFPSSRPPEVVRARYDRLRVLAARVQTVLGDFAAQGERVQALVSWRDPRATKLFLGVCFAVTVMLYVVPPKMVAVALGFYFLRHPMFRDPMPPASLSFFRRLPGLSDRLL